ncbi:MAG TPA: ribulose-phosphate 3-epimerase, partial [Myxococcota bacterium]|nr:ribulose-phosphate 3-epimerase [Myxococcota bacterium]
MVLIAPSILSANFLHLEQEIKAIVEAGADFIHIDVMDGHFVPNLTMGPVIIEAIKRVTSVPLDVHLMINNPSCYLESYVESGADLLTIHVESSIHLERDLALIRSRGAKAGVALNPSTHERVLDYVINEVDLVLVMSVNPGFSGQTFLPSAVKKIAQIKGMLKAAHNTKCIISVDGGINEGTAASCVKAGATCLVSGSY